MSLRTVLIILLALLSGGSAAVGINTFRNQAPASPKPDMVAIVVAATDIARGSTVSVDAITTREYPKEFVPPGVVTNLGEALDRVAFHSLIKGEPVLDAKLAGKGAGRGLAALIPRGMRAFTIQTSSVVAGVAGFVLPGSRVDVLLTVSSQGGSNDQTGGGTTTTLLQGIEILAVDQRLQAPVENKNNLKELQSVTLLVTPDQAAKLDLGQNKGLLHLTLRNPDDDQPADTRPATLASLRFQQQKPWDERAKALLETVGKLMAQKKPEKEPAKVEALLEPAPVVEKHIMTIHNGDVTTRVVFTLDNAGGIVHTEIEKGQTDGQPAKKAVVRPAPVAAVKRS